MTQVRITFDGRSHDAVITQEDDGARSIEIAGRTYRIGAVTRDDDGLRVTVDGRPHSVERSGLEHAVIDGILHAFHLDEVRAGAAAGVVGAEGAQIRPPMPGKIVTLKVQEGDTVAAGQVLLVLEAMKMQNEVTSPAVGRVRRILVRAGDVVDGKDLLLELGPVEDAETHAEVPA